MSEMPAGFDLWLTTDPREWEAERWAAEEERDAYEEERADRLLSDPDFDPITRTWRDD